MRHLQSLLQWKFDVHDHNFTHIWLDITEKNFESKKNLREAPFFQDYVLHISY
jgi:hypothetical protein